MTIEEMVDDVATAMGLTDTQRNVEHGSTGRSEVDYRMAWARTYLRRLASWRTASAVSGGSRSRARRSQPPRSAEYHAKSTKT